MRYDRALLVQRVQEDQEREYSGRAIGEMVAEKGSRQKALKLTPIGLNKLHALCRSE